MIEGLLISQIILWVVTLVLAGVLAALERGIAERDRRSSPGRGSIPPR